MKNGQEKDKRKIVKRIILSCLCIPPIVLVIALLVFLTTGVIGKARLKNDAPKRPELISAEVEAAVEEEVEWQEGWVKYQDNIYAYNEDILTFLFMGIDKFDEVVQETEEGTDGGQADALFLLVLNPHEKAVHIIGINRNAMADVDIYDEQGNYVGKVEAQIAVQHGFGNGMEESCEYQKEAVSRLLYRLPIHGYAAINMSAISVLNDAVGGVDVVVQEDMTVLDPALAKGAQVHLEGLWAFWYLQYRDTSVFGSADGRLARQKQYLTAFAGKAKEAVSKDLSVAAKLYQAAKPMMTTDISLDKAVYLATQVSGYSLGEENFHMLAGRTVQGKEFEEFYIDEEALYELILEVFYEPVE
ncbi:MAG: LCP family protein [Clostridium sp.]|nr:LCP family protein [Clostridium sp.]